MYSSLTHRTALWLCACCLGASVAYPSDAAKTLHQLQQEAAESQAAQQQPDGPELGLTFGPPKSVSCPDPDAVDLLKHQIAYERTEELDPLKGLPLVHAEVWMRGPLTGFYVGDQLKTFVPAVRMTYLFGADGLQGGGTCPVEKNWRECIEGFAGIQHATSVVRTCTTTIDLRAMLAWKPSPNDQRKRQIADELRSEVEVKWPGVQEIVVRDFNLKDNQITMYLKMPDGDYYQGCGFHAMREPHCESWHLFGMAPNSSIRKRIFDLPYRLK